MKIDNLRFGTGGIPLSTEDRNTINGIKQIKKLGLGAMELEFVQNVNVSEDLAKEVKKVAKENDVVLTAHGSYYINLNSQEKEKVHASMGRIISAAKRLDECGGYSLIFHGGFYLGEEKETVYTRIKDRFKEVVSEVQDNSIKLWIRPETMGKQTQFGSLKEVCKLSNDVEQVLPGIDWSHLHALTGKNNTLQEFRETLEYVEKELGRDALNNMHCHFSGINYGEKGEKNHLEMDESDFNYKDLAKVWKEFKLKGVMISESPNLEKDSLIMKRLCG
jgi:deoxyribonuclease IV